METFVNKEQAIKLKEIGFDEKVNHYFNNKNDDIHFSPNYFNFIISEYVISAPTLAQVQDWFIRNKNIKIIPNYVKNNFYTCKMFWMNEHFIEDFTEIYEVAYVYNFDTYEKALSVGIDKAIELIKHV